MSGQAHALIEGENLSDAWLRTVACVRAGSGNKMFHTMTVVDRPWEEDTAVRKAVDGMLRAQRHPPVETVANTIFPAGLANVAADAADLGRQYRKMYPRIRGFPGNTAGTYFGRLVQYPGRAGATDQLHRMVEHLRRESAGTGPMSAMYEAPMDVPEDRDEQPGTAVGMIRAVADNSRRGFPCMSLLSVQLDGRRLHMLAQYRYEYLLEKGYGNYLGLARLQDYIAGQAGLEVGQLSIVAGRVCVDQGLRRLNEQMHERGIAWPT